MKDIEEMKARFYRTLLSEDTERHILPLHFVSTETAEMRRRLDDVESSTFYSWATWRIVRKTIINWVMSENSDATFEKMLAQKEEWKDYKISFGPYKKAIGILFPMYGNSKECYRFVVKVIVHRYVDYKGKVVLDVRVKTIHPIP